MDAFVAPSASVLPASPYPAPCPVVAALSPASTVASGARYSNGYHASSQPVDYSSGYAGSGGFMGTTLRAHEFRSFTSTRPTRRKARPQRMSSQTNQRTDCLLGWPWTLFSFTFCLVSAPSLLDFQCFLLLLSMLPPFPKASIRNQHQKSAVLQKR